MNFKSEQKFLSRELSDLAFIRRVLEEADNPVVPVLERVTYLAITEKLLDEFYRYRIAELRAMIRSCKAKKSPYGMSPADELKQVDEMSNHLLHRQVRCWTGLKETLEASDIHIVQGAELTEQECSWFYDTFSASILSKTKPIFLKENETFLSLPSGEVLLLLEFADEQKALLPLSLNIPRFINVGENNGRFLLLENALDILLPKIFPERKIVAKGLFQVIREGDLKLSGEKDDLPSMVEEALENRKKSDFIRLKVNANMPESLRVYLAYEFGLLETKYSKRKTFDTDEVTSSEFVAVDGLLGLADSFQLVQDLSTVGQPDLFFPEFWPLFPVNLKGNKSKVFSRIKKQDILVHTPFESFETILHLLNKAAKDKFVTRIRTTIYRVGKNSPFVKALVRAARNGKEVTAIIELEARDDERSNLSAAEHLKAAGVKVCFGFKDMKVHAKAIEIIRNESGLKKTYVVLGTGNFHIGSAKEYTDIFLLTADPGLAKDTDALFEYISRGKTQKVFKEFALAPVAMRAKLTSLIQNETSLAVQGTPASILLKMNQLEDRQLIEELYAASNANVKITLIVRGICCLRPGIRGLSENIEVRSVVGRFLEHERIFCFSNGGPLAGKESKIFLSSADWMIHKIDKRVEIMVPIKAHHIKQQILTGIFEPYLRDQAQTWLLKPGGVYERKSPGQGFNAQEALLNR